MIQRSYSLDYLCARAGGARSRVKYVRIPNQTIRTQSMVSYDYASTCIPTLFGEMRTAPYDLRYWTILKLLEEERQAAGKAAVAAAAPTAATTATTAPITPATTAINNVISNAILSPLKSSNNDPKMTRATREKMIASAAVEAVAAVNAAAAAAANTTNVAKTGDETCLLGYLDDTYLRDEANVFEDWQRSSEIIQQVLGKIKNEIKQRKKFS